MGQERQADFVNRLAWAGRQAYAICFEGLGDVFYMSLILRHLKNIGFHTTLIISLKYQGIFKDGDGGIDYFKYQEPPDNQIEFYRQFDHSRFVFYYDLFRKRPDLIPWKNANWRGEHIFERYLNMMPCPFLKGLKSKDYVPIASGDHNNLMKTRERFPKSRPRIIMEYQPHSFHAPITHEKYFNLVKVLEQAGYECIWIAGPKHSGFSVGTDGRGLSFATTHSLIADSDAFIGIGSGLTCLACTLPNVYKVEIQNEGIYCFKTVFPHSINHEVIDPRVEDLGQIVLSKLEEQ